MKSLFESNIKQLRKVRDMLAISCKMNGTTVILGEVNKERLRKAKELIEKADLLLQNIN